MEYENAYNKHDLERFLGFFHEKAEIMIERKGRMVSKEHYADMLPERFKSSPEMTLRAPHIHVLKSGDKAVAEVMMKMSDHDYPAKISLILENNGWRIMRIKYY